MFLTHCSIVTWGAPRLLTSAPRLVTGTARFSSHCHQTLQICPQHSQALPSTRDCHFISPVNSGIWPPWDSGLKTPNHSQRLPVTEIQSVDVGAAGGLFRGARSEARHTASWNYTNGLTCHGENEGRLAASDKQSTLDWFCIQCQCITVAWRDRDRWLNFVFSFDVSVLH